VSEPLLSVRETAQAAKSASRTLAPLTEDRRNAILEAMAVAVEAAGPALLAANAEDLAAVDSLDEKLSPSTLSRLELNAAKLREMVEQSRSVAALPDPLGRILDATELDSENPIVSTPCSGGPQPSAARQASDAALAFARDQAALSLGTDPALLNLATDAALLSLPRIASSSVQQSSTTHGLHLQKISVSLGVLAVIFEARPDAVTQITALAIKSGNAVILKPGKEVERTATVLVDTLRSVVESQGLPAGAISLILGREQAKELLAMHHFVDMVIPRGSNALVEYVQANTRIPVLGHAEGVCHIFVDRRANEEAALRIIDDAKLDYPAACNAVETALVHREIAASFIPVLVAHLTSRGVTVHGDAEVQKLAQTLPVVDWHHEYGEPELAVGIVDSLDAAIDHIHRHGSSHTESILTEDPAAAEKFLREVDAAGVFHNASTRFADGFRYGFGAEVGISTSKFHARGPVGLEGLTTYKYVLRGRGHIAGDYRGTNARAFTHRKENRE
jgi:glutamate-5-semialdehyde dehydrogenase